MQGNGGYTELSMLCVVACGWCVTWIGTLHLDQVPAPHSKPCMLLVLSHVCMEISPPPPNLVLNLNLTLTLTANPNPTAY